MSGVPCSGSLCKGSIVNGFTKEYGLLKTRIILIKEAKDFIDSYFTSVEKLNSHEHYQRWNEISKSIDSTGTYQLKYEELCFGCKLAWRNAPRCIGRIQWNNLQVFDARNAKTCSDMFDAICRHISYCTNKGKIRSGITVFPHMTGKDEDFRIWNSQLIRYAGYQQSDGTILGDPISVEFTEVCQKLGWKGKGTMFDLLPLVLQINGNDPEVFDLPEDIILEVSLKHPRYPWFEHLGLKWYGLPSVSSMTLECGGLIFTAAPFSGWYMSTEIGARDLCDTQRYNLTEIVAIKMELDTKSITTLWKDKAILEVNVAVLHSFQKAGVTIIDHHSASESFMKFMEDENRLRGGCPADWVWIVPPISGSATQVFHQEMLLYQLKPSFDNVRGDPWSSHCWKSNKLKKLFEKRKLSLKSVGWFAMAVAIFMKMVSVKRVNCTILYATVTGNALRYANILERMFKTTFNVQEFAKEVRMVTERKRRRQTLLIEMVIDKNDGLSYKPGDHIGIFPSNNDKNVNYIISRFSKSVMVDEPIKVVRNIKKTSTEMATFATEKTDERKLVELAEDSNLYKTWRNEKYPSLCDVLKEFPSIKIYPEFLLTQFPVLKERFYSISSSSDIYPGEVHLTVGVVKYKKNDLDFEVVTLFCIYSKSIYLHFDRTPVFHLPANRSLPILMIGAGTGIAPFRSFWQQRKYDMETEVNENFGDMYLFFGCRDPIIDHIYHQELQKAEKEGAITKVFNAYSRQKGKQKVYVQDLVRNNHELITSEIIKKDGHIYVCGGTNMAKDVSSALTDIIKKAYVVSSQEAASIVQGLRDSNRYHEELYGPSVIPKY
ncbi:hypothetical protein KUTeg_022114 [Tegillarca granosa]|uniref:nitric-oxide synthase (NADPH) n=2 Tax=Tegillarca granosa TaxID=220873 RepID=A0ABQ9EAR5_TEGGR|nr:hypothetical protein KUTeg_022114 [Tegillarca granosa]